MDCLEEFGWFGGMLKEFMREKHCSEWKKKRIKLGLRARERGQFKNQSLVYELWCLLDSIAQAVAICDQCKRGSSLVREHNKADLDLRVCMHAWKFSCVFDPWLAIAVSLRCLLPDAWPWAQCSISNNNPLWFSVHSLPNVANINSLLFKLAILSIPNCKLFWLF